jgi:PEP-CTERM motif
MACNVLCGMCLDELSVSRSFAAHRLPLRSVSAIEAIHSMLKGSPMRRSSLMSAFAALLVVSPLGAQASWQAIGTPSNSGTAYWDNRSDDNVGAAVCNVGAILTNTPALTPTSCVNQAPVYLPLITPTSANVFLGGLSGANPGAFRFQAGTYMLGLLGRVAGNPTSNWGIITDGGVVMNGASLVGVETTITDRFSIWITQVLPTAGAGTTYSSAMRTGTGAIGSNSMTINQQFAVFTNGTATLTTDMFGSIINPVNAGETYYVGMEDNVNGGRGFGAGVGGTNLSDRDYNDIIVSVRPVPEPATVGLMGAGLLALAGIARRRRTA